MTGRNALLAVLALWPTPALRARSVTHPTIPNGHVIEVQLVDKGGGKWAFEPSELRAQQGDTIRFVQDDIVPHNVQFKSVPSGANLGAAMMGPFLLKKGDTYDLAIDGRFVPGTYGFVCTPHETMGMKGTLEVVSGSGDTSRPGALPPTAPGGKR